MAKYITHYNIFELNNRIIVSAECLDLSFAVLPAWTGEGLADITWYLTPQSPAICLLPSGALVHGPPLCSMALYCLYTCLSFSSLLFSGDVGLWSMEYHWYQLDMFSRTGFPPALGGFPPCLRTFLLSSTKTANTNEIRIHTDLPPQIAACFYGTFHLSFYPICTILIVTASLLPLFLTQAPRGRNKKANRQTENSKQPILEGKTYQAHR